MSLLLRYHLLESHLWRAHSNALTSLDLNRGKVLISSLNYLVHLSGSKNCREVSLGTMCFRAFLQEVVQL